MNKLTALMSLSLTILVMPMAAMAAVYPIGDNSDDLIGELTSVSSQYEDTFIEIGRAHNLGFEELRLANPDVDPWLPGDGTRIILPTEYILPAGEHVGIVINLPEYRIYYFYSDAGQKYVATLPVSVGRMDWATPLGTTEIVSKLKNPSWYPPASVRAEYAAEKRELAAVVPAGPDNPLGEYALRLGIPGYLIHGTNKPSGVGMRVTHGCLRLFPEDIAWLFPRVGVKTPVTIVDQTLKFGWRGDDLFIEVHPSLATVEDEDSNMTLVTRELIRATGERQADVDWQQVAEAFSEKSGLPVKVGSARLQ